MGGNTAYKNAWIAEKLDRVNLTMPKGKKAAIEEYCKAHGFASVNQFLNEAIDFAVASGLDKHKD